MPPHNEIGIYSILKKVSEINTRNSMQTLHNALTKPTTLTLIYMKLTL